MTVHVLGMTRAEMILKVVMSPLEPARAFVEQYVRLVQGKLGRMNVFHLIILVQIRMGLSSVNFWK